MYIKYIAAHSNMLVNDAIGIEYIVIHIHLEEHRANKWQKNGWHLSKIKLYIFYKTTAH